MNLIVPLSPPIEEQLLAFAAREGKAPEEVALEALREKLSPNGKHAAGPTPAQLASVVASRLEQGYATDLMRLAQDIAAAKGIIADLGLRFLEAEVECDPADPGLPWVLLQTEATGSIEDQIEVQIEWHRRMEKVIAVDHSHIRICIYPANS